LCAFLPHKAGIWIPTLDDVQNIHDGIINWLGGDSGIVNLGSASAALDFAERGPPTDAEIDLFDRAAFLLRGIAQDHPFTDGNKRTGLVVTWAFLLVNGFEVVASTIEAERFMLEVAQGHQDLAQMATWLRDHARKVK
jgi:death on curing protein